MADRARKATNRMMELQGILLGCQDGPQVRATINNVAVMDLEHLRAMPPQQMLWLKRGLNALKDHKQLQAVSKSGITEIA